MDQYIIFNLLLFFLKQHRSDERVPKASGSPVSCSAQCLSASSLVMVKSSGSSSFHLLTLHFKKQSSKGQSLSLWLSHRLISLLSFCVAQDSTFFNLILNLSVGYLCLMASLQKNKLSTLESMAHSFSSLPTVPKAPHPTGS